MRGHLCDWNGIKLIAFKLITWAPLICPLFRLLIFIIIDKQLKGGLADYLKTYYWGPSSSIYSSPLTVEFDQHYLCAGWMLKRNPFSPLEQIKKLQLNETLFNEVHLSMAAEIAIRSLAKQSQSQKNSFVFFSSSIDNIIALISALQCNRFRRFQNNLGINKWWMEMTNGWWHHQWCCDDAGDHQDGEDYD